MNDRSVILLLYAVAGGLAVILAVPLAERRVPPNGWYGFRIASTLKDPAVWYEVNARFGKWLLVSGLTSILASLVLYNSALSLDDYAWACLAALAAPLVAGVVVGFRAARFGAPTGFQ